MVNAPLRTLSSAAILAAAAFLTGCGSDGFEDCDGCGGPEPTPEPSSSCLEQAPATAPSVSPGVSKGFGTFTEVLEGGSLNAEYGGQGGSHVDVAALAYLPDGAAHVYFEVDGNWQSGSDGISDNCASGWHVVIARVFDPPEGSALYRVTLVDDDDDTIAESEANITVEPGL